MIVSIDPSAGFCWGVVRTINIAEAEMQSGKSLVSLGDIIHNPREVERLETLGLHTIGHKDLETLPAGSRVLIRAHGESPETYRLAHRKGLEFVDATCPVVTKLQERIKRFYDDEYQVVIFGKFEHAEVIGLRGVCNDECIVVHSLEEAKAKVFTDKKTVLFSQTTMDKASFAVLKDYMQERIQELVFESAEDIACEFHVKDTICGQVSGRENKLRQFAASNDVMIFIAGKKSSNGKVLYEICENVNKNTYFVEDCDEIDPQWITEAHRVGISGATSTPHWLMERAKAHIEGLFQAQQTKT